MKTLSLKFRVCFAFLAAALIFILFGAQLFFVAEDEPHFLFRLHEFLLSLIVGVIIFFYFKNLTKKELELNERRRESDCSEKRRSSDYRMERIEIFLSIIMFVLFFLLFHLILLCTVTFLGIPFGKGFVKPLYVPWFWNIHVVGTSFIFFSLFKRLVREDDLVNFIIK